VGNGGPCLAIIRNIIIIMPLRSYATKATDMFTIDMFGPKTNIFVSICPGYDYQEGERRRLTPRHTWMLTVEATSYNLLGSQRKDPNPTHYSVVWNEEEDQHKLEKVSPTNFGIVGSILIQRNAPTSAQRLGDRLDAGFEVCPLDLDGSVGSEHWMRLVLYGLQHHGLVQEFDVPMFMAFARAYLAKRMNGEGPPRIAYTREHRETTQKEKKRWRLSFPQAAPANQEDLVKEKKKRFRMSLPPVQQNQAESQTERKKRFRMSLPPVHEHQEESLKEKKKRFRMSLPQGYTFPDPSQKEKRRFRLSFPQAQAHANQDRRGDDVYGGLM
jgi:hypothetical protein